MVVGDGRGERVEECKVPPRRRDQNPQSETQKHHTDLVNAEDGSFQAKEGSIRQVSPDRFSESCGFCLVASVSVPLCQYHRPQWRSDLPYTYLLHTCNAYLQYMYTYFYTYLGSSFFLSQNTVRRSSQEGSQERQPPRLPRHRGQNGQKRGG